MNAKTMTRRNSNSGLAVKRLSGVQHYLPAEPPSYPPDDQKLTPFERVRDSVHDVLAIELRVQQLADKLLGHCKPSEDEQKQSLAPIGAPIFELNEHASDITAAVRRMHEVLDRFNPVLPS